MGDLDTRKLRVAIDALNRCALAAEIAQRVGRYCPHSKKAAEAELECAEALIAEARGQ